MSLQSAAQAALAVFSSQSLAVTMTAIAGAESGWSDGALGDCGLSGPSCEGCTSFGLWQIHTIHSNYLTAVTGSSQPCMWYQWLSTPENCAQAALAVYNSQGLGAWTTYQNGAYKQHLAQAQSAIDALVASSSSPSSTSSAPSSPAPSGGVYVSSTPNSTSSSSSFLLLGVLALAGIAGGLYLNRRS